MIASRLQGASGTWRVPRFKEAFDSAKEDNAKAKLSWEGLLSDVCDKVCL